MAFTISNEKLKSALDDIQSSLAELCKSEVASLEKALPFEKSPEKSPEKSAEVSAEKSKENSAEKTKEGSPEKTSLAEVSAEKSPEVAPPADPLADPAADTGPIGPEHQAALQREYEALKPEELAIHMLAIQAAQAKLGVGSTPVAPPNPVVPALSPSLGLGKSEVADIIKSEDRFAAIEAQVSALTKAIESAIKPTRQAATICPSDLAKSEPESYTRGEAQAILKKKLLAGEIKKSDQDLVVGFDFGRVSLEQVRRLLGK